MGNNQSIHAVKMSSSQIEARERLLNLITDGNIKLSYFTKCPLCKSNDIESLLDKDRHDIPCESKICGSCGLIFTSPHIASESLPLFYDKIYISLNYSNPNPEQLFNSTQGANIHSFIEEFKSSIKHIVDIGAGTGDVIKVLASELNEATVLGVDYNQDLVNRYTSTANSRMIPGGLDELVSLEQKFDLVILSHVLEHVVDLPSFLSKLKLILHNNSLLYIEVPGLFGSFRNSNFYEYSFKNFHTIAHVYNFTYTTLSNVFREHGFIVLKGDEKVRMLVSKASLPEKSAEFQRISVFLNKTLPHLKQSYFVQSQPYLKSNLSKIDSPLREIRLSEHLLNEKAQRKELIRLRHIENNYVQLKRNPISFFLRKIGRKLKQFFR